MYTKSWSENPETIRCFEEQMWG